MALCFMDRYCDGRERELLIVFADGIDQTERIQSAGCFVGGGYGMEMGCGCKSIYLRPGWIEHPFGTNAVNNLGLVALCARTTHIVRLHPYRVHHFM